MIAQPESPLGVDAVVGELVQLKSAYAKELHAIEQILGRALDYPWFKDDPDNFPGATEADGVCVGEHTAVSLADEAAKTIEMLRRNRYA